ncbi:hypothetical protein C8Q78DRAFT_717905 [Trametes maxima]|nr:hypothetical protein C8Q78DRAFT_717905 [Trametes maxima]
MCSTNPRITSLVFAVVLACSSLHIPIHVKASPQNHDMVASFSRVIQDNATRTADIWNAPTTSATPRNVFYLSFAPSNAEYPFLDASDDDEGNSRPHKGLPKQLIHIVVGVCLITVGFGSLAGLWLYGRWRSRRVLKSGASSSGQNGDDVEAPQELEETHDIATEGGQTRKHASFHPSRMVCARDDGMNLLLADSV